MLFVLLSFEILHKNSTFRCRLGIPRQAALLKAIRVTRAGVAEGAARDQALLLADVHQARAHKRGGIIKSRSVAHAVAEVVRDDVHASKLEVKV